MKQTTQQAPALSITEQARNIDAIVQGALEISDNGSFENAFAVADAMNQLREAITPDMMKRFMALQNTPLGFMTDKNPAIKNKNGEYPKPYDESVIKECVIEATLRGVLVVGNHWNVIASRCYITREGFSHKLRKLKGFKDFKPVIGIPVMREGGAIVPCSATWVYKDTPGDIKLEIPVRVNEGMGADAIIGKAQRKFMKRVFEQVTGSEVPDGDIEDVPLTRQIATPSGLPTSSAAGPVPDLFPAGQGNQPKTEPAELTAPLHIARIRKLLNDARLAESDLINDVIDKHGIQAESLEDLHIVTLEEILATFAGIMNRLNKKK